MEPIRVLQIVTIMNRGGLETMLMNYYRHIDRDRVQFDFLTHRQEKGDYDDEILRMGGRIFNTCPINPFYFRKYLVDLRWFFSTHRTYNIIHSHIDSLSTFPLHAGKNAGIPIRIARSHTTGFNRDIKIPFRYLSKAFLPSAATHYWGCSKSAVSFLFGKKTILQCDYRIIKNAIESEKFAYNIKKRITTRKNLNVENNIVFGHVGHFTFPKNHSFLIKVFKKIHEKEKNAILLLAGDGEEKAKIMNMVRKLGLGDSIKFLGVQSNISDLMQAMDVFLLTSFFEGFSIVLVEAQAAGLPILASDVVTDEVAITNLVKFFSLNNSVEEWADVALSLRHSKRVDTSAELKASGYDIVSESKNLENLYLKLTGKSLRD